jgi:hypothetical protein
MPATILPTATSQADRCARRDGPCVCVGAASRVCVPNVSSPPPPTTITLRPASATGSMTFVPNPSAVSRSPIGSGMSHDLLIVDIKADVSMVTPCFVENAFKSMGAMAIGYKLGY